MSDLEYKEYKDTTKCHLQGNHFKYKDIDKLKTKWWNKLCHSNSNQKEVTVPILISDRHHRRNITGKNHNDMHVFE